jgi:superoxide dismutase
MWWNSILGNGTCLLFVLKNRRPDYIEAFFNVINWDRTRRFVSENKSK